MDVFECIITRRSVRKYLDVPVEWDKIGTIMEAGKAAPSSGNIQNWKFIVVVDKEKRKAIAEACLQQNWMATAPVHIIVVAEAKKGEQFYGIRGERLYSVQNCAAATQNMLLMAHALGLGSCWVGAFVEEKLKTILSIPENVRPQSIITMGYSDEIVPPPMEMTLEDVMFFRAYGGQIHKVKDVDLTMGYTSGEVRKAINHVKKLAKKIVDKSMKKPPTGK